MGFIINKETVSVFDDIFSDASFVFEEPKTDAQSEKLLRRRGKFTSSNKHRLLASGSNEIKGKIEGGRGHWDVLVDGKILYTGKTKESASGWLAEYKESAGVFALSCGAKTYCKEVFVQRNTKPRKHHKFVSFDMQHGIDKEKEAVAAFIAATGFEVYAIGNDQELLESADGFCSGFPDGLMQIPIKAIIEAKAPKSETHYDYLNIVDAESLKSIEPIYYWQMQSNMNLFGDDCLGGYFITFDDGWFEEKHHLHYCWIERNQSDINYMKMKEQLAIDYVMSMQRDLESK